MEKNPPHSLTKHWTIIASPEDLTFFSQILLRISLGKVGSPYKGETYWI